MEINGLVHRLRQVISTEGAREWLTNYLFADPFEKGPLLENLHGCDVYVESFVFVAIPDVPVEDAFVSSAKTDNLAQQRQELGRYLMDAAWQQCVDGRLRPGPIAFGECLPENALGNAFSIKQ